MFTALMGGKNSRNRSAPAEGRENRDDIPETEDKEG